MGSDYDGVIAWSHDVATLSNCVMSLLSFHAESKSKCAFCYSSTTTCRANKDGLAL